MKQNGKGMGPAEIVFDALFRKEEDWSGNILLYLIVML